MNNRWLGGAQVDDLTWRSLRIDGLMPIALPEMATTGDVAVGVVIEP